MPFVPTNLPPKVTRSVVIQIKGPKYKEQIKRLNRELKKIARKHGAKFKKRPKTKRR
jgi:hypothetical protein